MAALRLYQLMFESEPNGLLGVSSEGQIIQFNSSAIRFFGYDLHKMRMQEISELAMPGAGDVNLKALFDEAMTKGEATQVECRQQDRRLRIDCFRLEDFHGQRGAFFRISEVQ
jgi:PAS domain S-box-containing protein